MAQHPLVSVCMPAYNHDRYVGEAIESILEQTLGDLELLIFDDRSADLTFDVIQSYCDDPRLIAERMPQRSGPSVTANAALARARGKYIALCASDDRWLPEKLERQVAYLEQHPKVDAVFCRPWLIGANGERLPDDCHVLGRDFGGESFTRTDWLIRFFFKGNCICASAPLLRASAVNQIGQFDPLLLQLQDFDYWLRFLRSYEFVLLSERLLEYRVDSGGVNVSIVSNTSMARTQFELHRLLRHFATDELAGVLATLRLEGPPAFAWDAPAPHQDLMLANLALHVATVGRSPAHFLFALDCLHRYGADAQQLTGGAAEARLFSLALFDVTGSGMMQDLFFGGRRYDLPAAAPQTTDLPLPPPADGLWHWLRAKLRRQ